jgi:DNA repair exonuclease SbcCD ATPase subunit
MIVSKKTEYEKFDTGIKELIEELERQETINEAIQDYIRQIRENDAEIGKINFSIKELEKFNNTLFSEIQALESSTVGKGEIKKLKTLKKEFSYLEKDKTNLGVEITYSEAARNMLQDTGIKTKVIKKYLPIMNKLINTYLNSMEFYVNFTLDENFNETIKSRYRDEFTYASFSEGEKMRIDLALLFTWRAVAKMKNSTNTNLLILDEIFDSSLDSTGTDEFLKILNTLGDENVFVISHKQDALADKFRSTIRFQKVKNFSHVAE